MKSQANYVKTALRVPPEVHRALHEAAKQADRTFNAEILFRLRQSFSLPQPARA